MARRVHGSRPRHTIDTNLAVALAAIIIAAAAARSAGPSESLAAGFIGSLIALAVWHVRLSAAQHAATENADRAERLDTLRLELLEERELYLLRLRALELTNRITPSFAWLTVREVEILVSRGLLHVDNLGFSVMATRAIHHELHSERARQLNERLDASRLGELGRDAEAWPVYVGESVQRDSMLLDDLRGGGEAAAKIAAKIEQVVWRRAH